MLVARTVSNVPEISIHLKNDNIKEAAKNVNKIVDGIRVVNKAEYIVVMNMNRIKLSHPVNKEIGKRSESQDLNASFSEHYYVTKAQGEAGVMIRAFVPIIDDQKVQVGIVVVGYSLPTFIEMLQNYEHEIFITILISLVFSIWGHIHLADILKANVWA